MNNTFNRLATGGFNTIPHFDVTLPSVRDNMMIAADRVSGVWSASVGRHHRSSPLSRTCDE